MGGLCGKPGADVRDSIDTNPPIMYVPALPLLGASSPREEALFVPPLKRVDARSVFCGDGGVGKTALLIRAMDNKWDDEYVPTIFDDYE